MSNLLLRALCLASLIAFGLVPGLWATPAMAEPQLAVLNANVLTMDPQHPKASAVVIEDGVIVYVGSNRRARRMAGPLTRIIDAGGRTIMPGFIDVHMHPRAQFDEMGPYGRLDLTPEAGVNNRADMFEKLQRKAAVTPRGQLIVCQRYQDDLIGGHPNAAELDAIVPDHPLILVHSSGHRRAVNSLALEAAGITDTTPDPIGGKIERDTAGKATGILLEAAPFFQSLYNALPQPSEAETLEAFRKEFRMFLAHGIVGIGDAGLSPEKLVTYRTLLRSGMPIRIYAMASANHLDWLIANRDREDWKVPGLTLNAVKVFHGNSLSGRTAWLYEPYHHDAHYYGLQPARAQEDLNTLIRRIHDAGLQAAVHSNGDREIDMTLTAIAAAQSGNPRPDPRHRIEHGSVAPAAIIARMRATGVALAPHSYILNHGAKLEDYGPERWNHIEPNRTAIDAGVPVGGNSDHPVSPPFVMQRIESLVTRRARSNGKVYGPDQRITAEEALRVWTMGSAYLQFEENASGSLTVGKRGDLVILSADPRKTDPEALETIRVDYTIVGGGVAYQRAHNGLPEQFAW